MKRISERAMELKAPHEDSRDFAYWLARALDEWQEWTELKDKFVLHGSDSRWNRKEELRVIWEG